MGGQGEKNKSLQEQTNGRTRRNNAIHAIFMQLLFKIYAISAAFMRILFYAIYAIYKAFMQN